MKLKIGVMFGGKSVEHEVSVISAIQAINALDKDKYEVVPVYISRDGRFFTGRDIGRIEAYRDIPRCFRAAGRFSFRARTTGCAFWS
jgi:D-alanine-D-alanine ligase